MFCSYSIGLSFTGRYYSNSMLPHCPALLSFSLLHIVTVSNLGKYIMVMTLRLFTGFRPTFLCKLMQIVL